MQEHYKILQGNCVDKLKELPDASIQCCVTSPPYWGLRDYGTANWVGGDSECDHLGEIMATHKQGSDRKEENKPREIFKKVCGKCGAIREDKQLGLEETPEEYVENMVKVFREVHRVLRDDGTLWLNLGDSYGKKKQLVGIPWRVAFALQADGWYLRQDIIWHKPNPMPESVKDRCTKAHEYIFLLTKNKKYYYDHEAIKEKAVGERWGGNTPINMNNTKDTSNQFSGLTRPRKMVYDKRNKRSVWKVAPKSFKGAHFAVFPPELIEPCVLAGCPKGGTVLDPFTGSGTSLMVAVQHGRHGIGIELNPEYIELAHSRIAPSVSLFSLGGQDIKSDGGN